MIDLRNRAIWTVIVASVAMILPSVASAKARLDGSRQTKTLDCEGGPARIAGSRNKVTLTGGCTRLTILGSRNGVTAAFEAGASVRFYGSKNEVVWTTPDGKPPKAFHLGFSNTLKEGQ
jgi:hypothetical protein